MKRQGQIAFYVRDCPKEQLLGWLRSVVGALEGPVDAGGAIVYTSAIGPIVVTSDMEEGPFTEVWFNTPNSPWDTDVDCARQAAKDLGCVVRCDPGQHFPEVHWASDIFLEISGGVERLIPLE